MTLSDDTLLALRRVIQGAQDSGRSPLGTLIQLQRSLPPGTALTIDFSATETLGHPLLVLDRERSAPPLPVWWSALSAREQEVALLVAEGRSNREIAGRLFIAVSTVKDHVHQILQKSGKGRRTAVAHELSRAGWPAR